MDTTYTINRNNRNFKWPIVILTVLVLLGGIGYLVFGASNKFISPIPTEPAMEIIFYTPTPEEMTPTSSPSATPKTAKKPSPTKKPATSPTINPTGGPAAAGSPTVTKTQATTTPSN